MSYVDGFVAAVPTANKDVYRRHAEEAAEIFRKHGALSFVECWGDDVPDGEVTSFPMAVIRVAASRIQASSRTVQDPGGQAAIS